MTWARNKVITDEWIDDYTKRENMTYENVMEARRSRWTRDDKAEGIGKHIGYELSVLKLDGDTYRYTVITPWQMSEGLCDTNGRDDDFAIKLLHEVDELMLEATETVRNERKKAKVVADSAKTTAKATAKPKDEPKDEPKPAPKRGRGRPKGSKDSTPRKRRTKAEINAATASDEPKTAPKASPTRTKSTRPKKRRTKAQIIAEADRIVARIRREKGLDDTESIREKKTPEIGSQTVTDRPKPHRDELGRVPLGDMGMRMTDSMAWIPDGLTDYLPKPIWTDGELEYVLMGEFFVPVPENAVKSKQGHTPGVVLCSNLKNGRL
jgi:hypothetical protein